MFFLCLDHFFHTYIFPPNFFLIKKHFYFLPPNFLDKVDSPLPALLVKNYLIVIPPEKFHEENLLFVSIIQTGFVILIEQVVMIP